MRGRDSPSLLFYSLSSFFCQGIFQQQQQQQQGQCITCSFFSLLLPREREKNLILFSFFSFSEGRMHFPPLLWKKERERKKKIVRPTLIYSKVKKRACAPFHFPHSMKKKPPRNYSSCLFEETAIHHISSVFHSPLCSFLLPSLPFPFLPMLSPPKTTSKRPKRFLPSFPLLLLL